MTNDEADGDEEVISDRASRSPSAGDGSVLSRRETVDSQSSLVLDEQPELQEEEEEEDVAAEAAQQDEEIGIDALSIDLEDEQDQEVVESVFVPV